jgi:hypothetical protein
VKITIRDPETGDEIEYPPVPMGQWTYDDADEVKRVCKLTVGQVAFGELTGDVMADLAYAVVAYRHSAAAGDPLELRRGTLDNIVVDRKAIGLGEEPDAEPEDGPSPPAEAADAAAEAATSSE